MTDDDNLLRGRLAGYEFHASVCGDRMVLKLTVDQAMRVIESVLGADHYAIFSEDRWVVEHSLSCRLSGQMEHCAYHKAIANVMDGPPVPDMLGRWRITDIDEEGCPGMERDRMKGAEIES